MNEIENELSDNMINLYHKVLWKPKVGDPVSELFYPENGIGVIKDLIHDSHSSTALVRWESSEQEYIETRHLSLVINKS
jgi:hypothetical protein